MERARIDEILRYMADQKSKTFHLAAELAREVIRLQDALAERQASCELILSDEPDILPLSAYERAAV